MNRKGVEGIKSGGWTKKHLLTWRTAMLQVCANSSWIIVPFIFADDDDDDGGGGGDGGDGDDDDDDDDDD